MAELSTKPYLIRAIHQWCEDSGFRPYIAVAVDERTQVPREFVRNGEIVLNVSAVATNRLQIGNELIEFEARFSGTVRQVSIPIDNVSAIYAQETGHGMAFDVPKALALPPESAQPGKGALPAAPAPAAPKPAQRPKLVPKPAADPVTPADAGAAPDADAGLPASPQAGPALQSVPAPSEAKAPAGRANGSKSRRRGKLSAVPDARNPDETTELVQHDSPAREGAPSEPGVAPGGLAAAGIEAGSTAEAPNVPDLKPVDVPASAAGEPPPEEPPPAPQGRPQLKRVK